MKKTILAISILSLSIQSSNANDTNTQRWINPGYWKCALGSALVYATLKVAAETIKDMGYRDLFSRQQTNIFKQELTEDSDGLLTERAINNWGKVQYLSTIPDIWWREIVSASFTGLLGYFALRILKDGFHELRK